MKENTDSRLPHRFQLVLSPTGMQIFFPNPRSADPRSLQDGPKLSGNSSKPSSQPCAKSFIANHSSAAASLSAPRCTIKAVPVSSSWGRWFYELRASTADTTVIDRTSFQGLCAEWRKAPHVTQLRQVCSLDLSFRIPMFLSYALSFLFCLSKASFLSGSLSTLIFTHEPS